LREKFFVCPRNSFFCLHWTKIALSGSNLLASFFGKNKKKIGRLYKKKGKNFDLALRRKKLLREILSTGASQRVHPALHPTSRILDIFITSPFF